MKYAISAKEMTLRKTWEHMIECACTEKTERNMKGSGKEKHKSEYQILINYE